MVSIAQGAAKGVCVMDLEELTVRDRFAMAALNGLMGTVTMPDKLKETDI
jgi:hypothetical protein